MAKRGTGIRYTIPKAELMEMIEADMTIAEMADRYGCHRRTIQDRLKKYGIQIQPVDVGLPERVVLAMYAGGLSQEEISDHFGCSKGTVAAITQAAGLTRPKHRMMGKWLGQNSHVWEGGIDMNNGYIRVQRYGKLEILHRLVAEHVLERSLSSEEVVHHMDENRCNNHPDNLLVCRNTSEHMKLHAAMRRDPNLDQRQWIEDYRAQQKQAA